MSGEELRANAQNVQELDGLSLEEYVRQPRFNRSFTYMSGVTQREINVSYSVVGSQEPSAPAYLYLGGIFGGRFHGFWVDYMAKRKRVKGIFPDRPGMQFQDTKVKSGEHTLLIAVYFYRVRRIHRRPNSTKSVGSTRGHPAYSFAFGCQASVFGSIKRRCSVCVKLTARKTRSHSDGPTDLSDESMGSAKQIWRCYTHGHELYAELLDKRGWKAGVDVAGKTSCCG